MRKKLMVVLALGATLALAFAAVSAAKWSIFQAGNLVLKADGGVTPTALPKKTYAPVKVNVKGEISSKTGGHPAAIREALIDFDKNGKIDTTGLPTCKGSELEARDTKSAKKVCGDAIDLIYHLPRRRPCGRPVPRAPSPCAAGGRRPA